MGQHHASSPLLSATFGSSRGQRIPLDSPRVRAPRQRQVSATPTGSARISEFRLADSPQVSATSGSNPPGQRISLG